MANFGKAIVSRQAKKPTEVAGDGGVAERAELVVGAAASHDGALTILLTTRKAAAPLLRQHSYVVGSPLIVVNCAVWCQKPCRHQQCYV